MFLRIALFAMMALGLCGLGVVALLAARTPGGSSTAEAATPVLSSAVQVLAAARPLRAGALIKPEDIVTREVKREATGEDTNLDTPRARAMLVGAMLKRSVGKDDLLHMADVMRPTEHGFLAAVVGQGMRAATIGVDAISGTAGLISPGDRVDVILTQTIEDPLLPIGRRIAAETVLMNVRVVAIDQQILQGQAQAEASRNGHTVTLEVTSVQAERVAVASRIGRLSLSVRSADTTNSSMIATGPIWASDVSRALMGSAPKPGAGTLKVYPGAGEAREFKF